MQSLVIFFLFVGIFMIVIGIYEEKIKDAKNNVKVEYKFIPRTYYEEQLADGDVSLKMYDMFAKESPWYDRTIGALADVPYRKESQESKR